MKILTKDIVTTLIIKFFLLILLWWVCVKDNKVEVVSTQQWFLGSTHAVNHLMQ